MRQVWMRKILLFSMSLVVLASCTKPEYSTDEPFVAELQTNMYVVSEGSILYALDPATGDMRWKFHDLAGITFEPLALGDYVFVNTPANVLKLNAITGDIVDTLISNTKNKTPNGPLNGEGNFVYVPYTAVENGTPVSVVSKFNYTNNEETSWKLNGGGLTTSPVIFGKTILVPFAGELKVVSTEDANALLWSEAVTNVNNPATDGVNVFITSGNTLSVYNFEKGGLVWSYTAADEINTSPILYGGNILFGCNDNKLYCIDSIARAPRWTFLTDERIFSSPYAYDQTIYFGSNDHYFYAVNVDDGSLKWRYRTNALIRTSPIAHEGTVYIGSYDQHVYAFDTSGAMNWKYLTNGLLDKSPAIFDPMNNSNKQIYSAVSGLSSQ